MSYFNVIVSVSAYCILFYYVWLLFLTGLFFSDERQEEGFRWRAGGGELGRIEEGTL